MSEALLLSVIHKLETDENEPNENEANENETDDDEPNENEANENETDDDEPNENEADEDENIDETDEDEADEDETDEYETDDEFQTYDGMERVIKEMREFVDIVRDKKLEEGKTLNFLVSDLVDMAGDALHISKRDRKYIWDYASIHSWMGEIKKQMLKLGDDDESNIRSSENVDDEEDDNYVVGLEGDVKMLLRTKIIDWEHYLKNILIKGMAGIGKTTLAREIYNHPIVIKRFERRAWVSNSTHFTTLKELLIKLIQQVEDPQNLHTSSSLENMDNRSLRDMISQHLRGKQFLIVLDDVPKQMRLMSFRDALPKEDNGSRLLFTSHTQHVDIFVYDQNVYKMNPLNSKDSWKLFMKTINHGNKLTGDHKFPKSLEPMGKQMLRKCMWRSAISYKRGRKAISGKESLGREQMGTTS